MHIRSLHDLKNITISNYLITYNVNRKLHFEHKKFQCSKLQCLYKTSNRHYFICVIHFVELKKMLCSGQGQTPKNNVNKISPNERKGREKGIYKLS